MAETNLSFSKIVATPTPTAWSQAYSAGRLFAAISLQTDTVAQGEEHLNSVGKDLISTLESEFFTLENKDLDSIKQALTTTISRVREGVRLSLVVCFLSENVLYLFAIGGGKAILKRGDKIGTVLEGDDESEIKSASGYVQESDIIILQTNAFQKVIPSSTLASTLDHNSPDEIAENLAPHVHEKAEGGASAVILLYKEGQVKDVFSEGIGASEVSEESQEASAEEGPTSPKPEETHEQEEIIDSKEEIKLSETFPIDEVEETENLTTEASSPFLTDQFPKKKRLSFSLGLSFLRKTSGGFSHQRRIILTIAVILIILIGASSFLALRNRDNSQNQEAFAAVFTKAQEKYDEGQNLKDINASLAQESFREAKKILDENRDKFPNDSDEDKQIEDLLSKVNKVVSETAEGQSVSAKEVGKSESKLLSYEIDNSSASFFTQNEDFVYFLDGKGVNKIDKGNNEKETIIEKNLKKEGGIGLFGSNVYVLDKGDGILKFVPSGEDFSETKYFSGDAPDLGNAAAIAIDGSVYVLFDDGSIKKYTRGKEDSFEVSGVEKAMSNPTRIFVSEDADNIYILDNGNSRIVVLDKTGKFVSAYSAGIIKNAKDLDVNESGKKIFVLSGGKVYQIDIK